MVTPFGATSRMMVSDLLGARVVSEDGSRVGHVVDLVADLAGDLDQVPVTSVLIERRGHNEAVAWTGLLRRTEEDVFELRDALVPPPTLAPSEVLVGRDILDAPVVLADPPRNARVSDVVLEVDAGGARIVEIDVSGAGVLRRLLGRPRSTPAAQPVRLSGVHLASSAGHAAQVTVPTAPVFRLGPQVMAEVLTRVPVAHARDILRLGDGDVVEQALSLLHPHVRSRVTGETRPLRRARRLAGWRLRRPRAGTRGRSDE